MCSQYKLKFVSMYTKFKDLMPSENRFFINIIEITIFPQPLPKSIL